MRLAQSHKILGVAFMAMLLASVYLTYAIFTKKFADYDEVTLKTSNIGLQLPERADVKIRGVIVGEVLDFQPTAEGADVTLGLYPDHRETIPADVSGSIVPKTLFGEKYVSLVPEEDGESAPIEPGATIERTEVSIEVEKVLSDLYPLLRTVQPAELNMTLNAMATALEGRGELIGENLETVDSYLKRLNPQIPEIVEDLRLTAEVSDVYADIMPEVADILRTSVTTTTTLEEKEAEVNALFTDVAAFSDTSRDFLERNGDNIIRLGEVSEQQLRVLAKYSPEFPCLAGGIVNAGKLQAEAFRNFTLHINLEPLPNQPRGYKPQDKPRFGEDRGPNCLRLPNPPYSQSNPVRSQPNMDDGVDEPTGKGTSRTTPGFGVGTSELAPTGFGVAGSSRESTLLKSLLGPSLGVTAGDVPDLGVLLIGPMARGAEVSYR